MSDGRRASPSSSCNPGAAPEPEPDGHGGGGPGERRRTPLGAEVRPGGGVSFRVWAPERRAVRVVTADGPEVSLRSEPGGYFHGAVPGAGAGTRYRYRIDGELLPDPASRFQPLGPHGPSEVVDPSAFPWTDAEWRGVDPADRVLYEMHLGTFTPEGTWRAALPRLEPLAELGVTLLQVMPVAEFAGGFGWGYDGVLPYAPTRLYGRPDDFRRFVDRAHALGMGVLLDLVYNHVGSDGGPLGRVSPRYLSDRHRSEWGACYDLDGPGAGPVREFLLESAAHWIRDYHLDGFRIDAADEIPDESDEHLVAALRRRVEREAPSRRLFVAGEAQSRDTRLLRTPGDGGLGLDALYNEDFHHAVAVAVTGRAEAYRSDYRGRAQEMVSLARRGFLYQGQRSAWEGGPHGAPSEGLGAGRFVNFVQNHDQVANALRGARLHQRVGPDLLRAATAFLLLAPGVPMLFQGQEFGASSPFLFFADPPDDERDGVRDGRASFLGQFPALASEAARGRLPDPTDPATFVRCKLDPAERSGHAETVRLHRDLLEMRRETAAFRDPDFRRVDGAVLAARAFVLRYRVPDASAEEGGAEPEEASDDRRGHRRLLVVNFGPDRPLRPAPEPLLAPPPELRWAEAWSSEDPRYGGEGTAPVVTEEGWALPARSATVLEPR